MTPESTGPQHERITLAGIFRRLGRDENGQAMIEYSILIADLVVVIILTNMMFNSIVDQQMMFTFQQIALP